MQSAFPQKDCNMINANPPDENFATSSRIIRPSKCAWATRIHLDLNFEFCHISTPAVISNTLTLIASTDSFLLHDISDFTTNLQGETIVSKLVLGKSSHQIHKTAVTRDTASVNVAHPIH